jgi:hypothetical protein
VGALVGSRNDQAVAGVPENLLAQAGFALR